MHIGYVQRTKEKYLHIHDSQRTYSVVALQETKAMLAVVKEQRAQNVKLVPVKTEPGTTSSVACLLCFNHACTGCPFNSIPYMLTLNTSTLNMERYINPIQLFQGSIAYKDARSKYCRGGNPTRSNSEKIIYVAHLLKS